MSQSLLRRIVRSTSSAIIGAACVATLLVTANAAHAQGLYQSQTPNLNTAGTPVGVASADFALSGFRSLVVTASTTGRRGNNYIQVYLGTASTPAPTFANAVDYTTCTGPTAVLAQDLNGDGYPDIAVACPSSDTVDIFFNEGAAHPGTFGEATSYTANNAVAMVAGDFRGIGQIDLAVANSSGGVTYLKNNNGTFTTSTVGVAAGVLSGITAGDFNHDGNLDLALSDSNSNNVHVVLGTGTGTFGAEVNYSAGAHTTAIQTADFNHDGNLDLAVTSGNNASILLGTAAGAFTLHSTTAAGTGPTSLAVTDVDSDGNPDVVAFDAITGTTGEIAVLLGNGNGTLQAAQISTLNDAAGKVPAVDDFNRDGKPDLAVVQISDDVVSVLVNNTLPTAYPDGRSYAAANALTNGKGNMADSVAVGDFNKDGNLDIAVAYLEDNAVRVLLNSGNSTFGTAVSYPVGKQPYWVASGDLNGDSYPDLVTANTTDGTVSVLINNGKAGNGTFKAATYTVGTQPYQVAIGDVNSDGFPDLAVTNYGANTVTVLKGSAAGTFTTLTTLSTCANPYGVAIGDFKHDGYPAIAVSCYSAAQLEVFPNNENGTFGTPVMLTTDVDPSSLVVGDFNRDGKLDIVVGNTTANDVYFFAGNGNNGFGAGVESPSLNFPDSIAAGDVNGDGILDIVGIAPNFNNAVVTLGVGDGTFGTFNQRSAGEFPATKQPWAVALGDFNNDGQLDIVTANTYNQVNIASPAYQARYIAEYPAIPAGNLSIDVLLNTSAANVTVSTSPATIPANNSGTTIKANVLPALSGATPTGSVIFEDATGSPVGTGPYALSAGVASYKVGHLGSGQYLFTSLYSGDANYQPTTVSGSGAAITVPGTPVTLSLNPTSVQYGNTFVATVTAIGNTTTGSYPRGSATIYIDTGTSFIAIGTTTAFQQVGGGSNNSSRTITITATAPNLNAGTYELYAVFNPSSGAYTQGSSSDEPLTVVPTPPTLVTLSLNPSTVPFGNSFVATVTATGNTTTGSYPHGTATIYIDNGGTPIAIGTTTAFQQVGGGNNSSRTITITTSAPNLNVGSYQLYAVFNPTTPPYYGPGTSADVTLTVTQPRTPTSTAISCTGGLFGGTCTSTTTVLSTGVPVTTGNTVNFSGAGTGTETTNAAGQTTWNYSAIIGSYTITASFPAQGTYAASSNSTGTFCFIVCGLDRGTTTSLNSLSGLEFDNFATPTANRNGDRNQDRNQDQNRNQDRNQGRNVPFFLF